MWKTELLEEMANARRIRQEQLRAICQQAKKENRKTAEVLDIGILLHFAGVDFEEVVYIQREQSEGGGEGERESLERKHKNAFKSRSAKIEKMRSRLLEQFPQLLEQAGGEDFFCAIRSKAAQPLPAAVQFPTSPGEWGNMVPTTPWTLHWSQSEKEMLSANRCLTPTIYLEARTGLEAFKKLLA